MPVWVTLFHCGNERESILVKKKTNFHYENIYIVGYADEISVLENVDIDTLIEKNLSFHTVEEAFEKLYELPYSSMFPIEIDRSISYLMIDIIPQIVDSELKPLWKQFFTSTVSKNT